MTTTRRKEKERENFFFDRETERMFQGNPVALGGTEREKETERAREKALHFRGKPNNSSKNSAAPDTGISATRMEWGHSNRTSGPVS